MMKKIYFFTVLFSTVLNAFSQTNPPALPLPVSVNFGTAAFTPPYTNTVAWTGDGTRPYATQTAAESSLPGSDVTSGFLFNTTPGTAPSGGQYGDAHGGNARLVIAGSGNATAGTTQLAISLNTTGSAGANISYSLGLAVSNPRTIGVVLQYRVGTSGSFTTIAGSAVTYTAGSANDGDADGTNDYDNYSFPLPAAALNQPEVQIRWATWRGGAGNSSGVFIDNIVVGTPLPACAEPTAQPTNLNLSATASTVSGTFTLIPDPTTVENYLVVRSLSASLSSLPVDGTTYTAGQVINGGNGTVVGTSNGGTFTDNGLAPSTTYYYYIFAINDQACSGGPNYFQVGPLTGDITTSPLAGCITPAAPAALNLTASNTSVSGSFTGTGAGKYLVAISTSNTIGAVPTNGTTYTPNQVFGSGTVVSFNTSTNFLATNLTNSTTYYIYVFAANTSCTGEPFYSTSSLNGNITTTNVAGGIPPGYYSAAGGLTCQQLKTALRNASASGYVSLSYDDVYTAYQFTDLHRNDANTADIIWDMYSDRPAGPEPYTYTYPTNECGNYSGEGDCYNREHSTPKSWFNDALPMYTDVQHLYPTDGSVNGIRSNYPYGEVTNPTKTTQNGSKLGTGNNFGYTAVVFEPINEYKGDLARTSLYMATRYENEIIGNNWSANGTSPGAANNLFLSTTDEPDAAKRKLQIYDTWYLKTMFKWLNQDPVSQKEIDRNNAIYYQTAQHNRNPYVDHPEYAAMVFQCTGVVPVTIVDFTAQKNKETVLLKWYATYETAFKQYDVERSTDGINFNKIGEVAGSNIANYSFTDNFLPKSSVVYYRLKMIDIDGKFKTGKIASVRLNNNLSNAVIYPNPVRDNLNIRLDVALAENCLLRVFDVTGRIVKTQSLNANEINLSVDVKTLSPGRYFIKIVNSKQMINESFVVIN